MNSPVRSDSNDARTVYCGNLHSAVTDELLYELFLQVGPVRRVYIPKDKDGKNRNYGFVEFAHVVSVEYATKALRGTLLFGQILQIKPRDVKGFDRQTRISPECRMKHINSCPRGCREECPVTGVNGSVTLYLASLRPGEQTVEDSGPRPQEINLMPQLNEVARNFNPGLFTHPQFNPLAFMQANIQMQQQQIWQQQQQQQGFAFTNMQMLTLRHRFLNPHSNF